MKVLVLSNMAPFVWGGAEELAFHLVCNLRLSGVTAEAMRIPFSWNPAERLIDEMTICRSLRIANTDRVIALKFPTYLVPHDNKVLWVLHQFRQAYDLWDAGQSSIPDTPRGRQIREAIRTADESCFDAARRLFCNSPTTRERMRRYSGFDPEVLAPPLNDPELFGGGDYGGYVLASGRVNRSKRQWLLVEAMRHVRSSLRLVIAGPCDRQTQRSCATLSPRPGSRIGSCWICGFCLAKSWQASSMVRAPWRICPLTRIRSAM
jgi:glycosyltransferase involved in cell wall biosynthesis